MENIQYRTNKEKEFLKTEIAKKDKQLAELAAVNESAI